MTTPQLHIDGPKKAKTCLVLAHGAGESSSSKFLSGFAEHFAEQRHRVVRFDFPYMAARSIDGRRRPPDKESVLRETWKAVVESLPYDRLIIGGKSMGGRIATLVADELQVAGVVCLGYPFHPAGRPEQLRVEHLETIQTPTLIVQGEIDPFGSREEVESFQLSDKVQVHWVPEGDHSYNVKRGSDRSLEQNLKNATRSVEQFLFEIWSAS
ncbi:alpha/beta fold hydrolase [Planctomicrobium sp. SH661]|uniref:alpha/beta fold hydrolase n=1 Tax=Planctomicrobium sp. SH661 TaxID=3448124 RepID=UPI003F5C41A5